MRGDRYQLPGTGPGDASGLVARIKARKRALIITAVVVAGLAFAAGWNPPTNTVHSFTEASDYNARRESGCTNSGEGCHGDDADLKDFNLYHPDTDCKTCHDYTGVGCIPCHGPQQTECAGCHDGTMEGASDCVRLGDSYPKGHYRESLHEAVGTKMDQIIVGAPGGEAKAACGDCHSRDLRAAHTAVPEVEGSDYGPDIGCAECHNDEQSGALEQVLNDWEQHRCEDCHGEDSRAPMHAADIATPVNGTGDLGCGDTGDGCHAGNDLHVLHPDAPATCSGSAAEGEPGCHDLQVQAHKPTATSCGPGDGSCHPGYRNTVYAHKEDASTHVSNRQQGATFYDALSGVGMTCGVCHAADLNVEHGRSHSPLAGDTCQGCHNDSETTVRVVKESWTERDSAQACAACHGNRKHENVGTVHRATQIDHEGHVSETGCVKSGCHASPDVRVLHQAKGCALAVCHSSTGRISGTKMTCGGEDSASATNCHTRSARHTGADAAHIATQVGRDGTVSATACARPGCHPSADVRVLHEEVGACYTAGCHVDGGPTYMTCGGAAGAAACHTASDKKKHANFTASHTGIELNRITGEPAPGSCVSVGCHATVSVYEIHHDVGCAIPGCHVEGGPTGVVSCGGPAGTPNACHTGAEKHYHFYESHAMTEIDNTGAPAPGLCVQANCHATTSGYEIHHDVGCNIWGCHYDGGLQRTSCGGPAGWPTACHQVGHRHVDAIPLHEMTEYDDDGNAVPGTCVTVGCHTTTNAYDLHNEDGCDRWGCHLGPNPTIKSCGGGSTMTGLACHQIEGVYRHKHFLESHTFTEINHLGVPEVGACATPGCHPSNDVTIVHANATPEGGCNVWGCHYEGGLQRTSCGGTAETVGACHQSGYRHDTFYVNHIGVETVPGTCVKPGCHATAMQYELHHAIGCTITGCHTTTSVRPTPMTCGGDEGTPGACHAPSPPTTVCVELTAPTATGVASGIEPTESPAADPTPAVWRSYHAAPPTNEPALEDAAKAPEDGVPIEAEESTSTE